MTKTANILQHTHIEFKVIYPSLTRFCEQVFACYFNHLQDGKRASCEKIASGERVPQKALYAKYSARGNCPDNLYNDLLCLCQNSYFTDSDRRQLYALLKGLSSMIDNLRLVQILEEHREAVGILAEHDSRCVADLWTRVLWAVMRMDRQ